VIGYYLLTQNIKKKKKEKEEEEEEQEEEEEEETAPLTLLFNFFQKHTKIRG
jgi:ribosomal protein L12E/L44/L45/RPP1/RPP2